LLLPLLLSEVMGGRCLLLYFVGRRKVVEAVYFLTSFDVLEQVHARFVTLEEVMHAGDRRRPSVDEYEGERKTSTVVR